MQASSKDVHNATESNVFVAFQASGGQNKVFRTRLVASKWILHAASGDKELFRSFLTQKFVRLARCNNGTQQIRCFHQGCEGIGVKMLAESLEKELNELPSKFQDTP